MANKKKAPAKKPTGRMKVTLANLAGDPTEVTVARGSSLKAVLLAAGYAEDTHEGMLEGVRVNGREVKLNARVAAGAIITIAPAVQGGVN